MNPILYVKIGVCAVLLGLSWYLGFSFERSRFLAYRAEQTAQIQKIQESQQAQADQIRKQKDAQIADINARLADAISQLRSRPSRAQAATNGQSCNGASLPAEDAEFLVREAARADQMRTGLLACYQQYDSLNK